MAELRSKTAKSRPARRAVLVIATLLGLIGASTSASASGDPGTDRETSIVVRWTTIEPALGIVVHGADTSYGSAVAGSATTTEHEIQVRGLECGTTVEIRTLSIGVSGSVQWSESETRATPDCPVPLAPVAVPAPPTSGGPAPDTPTATTPDGDDRAAIDDVEIERIEAGVAVSFTSRDVGTGGVLHGATAASGSEVRATSVGTTHRLTVPVDECGQVHVRPILVLPNDEIVWGVATVVEVDPCAPEPVPPPEPEPEGEPVPSPEPEGGPAAPPQVSGVEIRWTSRNSVVLAWTTDVVATGEVNFGPAQQYRSASPAEGRTTRNHIRLTDLACATTYHFSVIVTGLDGLTASSGDHTFTTADCDTPSIDRLVARVNDGGVRLTGRASFVAELEVMVDGVSVTRVSPDVDGNFVVDVAAGACDLAHDVTVEQITGDVTRVERSTTYTAPACPSPSPPDRPMRVMAIGDSITVGLDGTPAWRSLLSERWEREGLAVDMVGDQSGLPWGSAARPIVDDEHQAFVGQRSDAVVPLVVDALDTHRPDLLLVHVGTNDVLHGRSAAQLVAELEVLLDAVALRHPETHVAIATLSGCAHWRCGDIDDDFEAANDALRQLVADRAASGASVSIAELSGVLDTESMTFDGLHPDTAGDHAMADGWFDAVSVVLAAR